MNTLSNSYGENQCIASGNPTINDSDGDGIYDTAEKNGIDSNNDGIIDLNLKQLGANATHKDIFVEIDYMKNHKPNVTALDDVVRAFEKSPVCNPDNKTGINLHLVVDEEINHINNINLICRFLPNTIDWTNFEPIKKDHFGTISDKSSPNFENIKKAKEKVFYYAVYIHQIDSDSRSGCSNPVNHTMVISYGNASWITDVHFPVNLTTNEPIVPGQYESGTFMHEIGHLLWLQHGGFEEDDGGKPNYVSVVNPLLQNPIKTPDRVLDYSDCVSDLNENSLNDSEGIHYCNNIRQTIYCKIINGVWTGFPVYTDKDKPIDFDGNQSSIQDRQDINCNSTETYLKGYNDWSNLKYINSTEVPLNGIRSLHNMILVSNQMHEQDAKDVVNARNSFPIAINELAKQLPESLVKEINNTLNGNFETKPLNSTTAMPASHLIINNRSISTNVINDVDRLNSNKNITELLSEGKEAQVINQLDLLEKHLNSSADSIVSNNFLNRHLNSSADSIVSNNTLDFKNAKLHQLLSLIDNFKKVLEIQTGIKSNNTTIIR